MKALSRILLLTLLISFFSCEDDEVTIPNEEEVITTVIYTLTATGEDTVVIEYSSDENLVGEEHSHRVSDEDDEDEDEHVHIEGHLVAGVTYTGTITLLNELDSTNIIDVTDEVIAENEDHLFVYELEGCLLYTSDAADD